MRSPVRRVRVKVRRPAIQTARGPSTGGDPLRPGKVGKMYTKQPACLPRAIHIRRRFQSMLSTCVSVRTMFFAKLGIDADVCLENEHGGLHEHLNNNPRAHLLKTETTPYRTSDFFGMNRIGLVARLGFRSIPPPISRSSTVPYRLWDARRAETLSESRGQNARGLQICLRPVFFSIGSVVTACYGL